MKDADIRREVRQRYGGIVRQQTGSAVEDQPASSCCGEPAPAQATGCCGSEQPAAGCCDSSLTATAEQISEKIGYSAAEMGAVPEGANLGLGCGNPTAIASIQPGETVLDLGSGAGFDCFLASKQVGPDGSVIGVDMTPDMIEAARQNAAKGGYENVEFRLGEIENLPVPDATVDLVISNCVVNLSVNKQRVFNETFRALKPGGRLMISDIVLNHPLPEKIAGSPQAYCECISGAALRDDYLQMIGNAGFTDVEIVSEAPFSSSLITESPEYEAGGGETSFTTDEVESAASALVSANVYAKKPD